MDPNLFIISTGIGKDESTQNQEIQRLKNIFSNINCNWICIDIANGYISNLRIIKGQAIYSKDFTPPTAAFKA